MYPVNDQFKQISKEKSRYVEIKCNIDGKDYIDITEFNLLKSISNEGEFQFGKLIASKLSIKVRNANNIPSHSKVIPYVRFSHDIGNTYTEWLPLGHFFIDNRYYNSGIVSITAYDKTIYLDNIYDSKLKYPAKASEVINEIATKRGFALNIEFDDINIEVKPIDYTERQIIEYIACCHASSPLFNNEGVLKFNDFTVCDEEIDLSNAISQSIDDQYYTIRKIDCVRSKDSTFTLGESEGDYSTISFENPFMTKEQFESRFTKYIGFKYYNSTIEKTSQGYFEVGDAMQCFNTYNSSTKATIILSSLEIDFSSSGLFKESIISVSRKPSDTDYVKTDDIESRVKNETKELNDAVYYYENEGVLSISSELTEIIRIRFTANAECTPMFHANIIFKIDVGGLLEFEYIVDNMKHRVEPKQTVSIGYCTLHLFLPMYNTKGSTAHDLILYVKSVDATGSINRNQIQATINGQGLEVLDNKWDGTLQFITEIEPIEIRLRSLSHINVGTFTTNVEIKDVYLNNINIAVDIPPITIRPIGNLITIGNIEATYGHTKLIVDEQIIYNYINKHLFISDERYLNYGDTNVKMHTEFVFNNDVEVPIDNGKVKELAVDLEQFKQVESVVLEVEQ